MVALDQIGTMLSPCSPRMRALTCVAGTCRRLARLLRKRVVSSTRAQADDALPRQARALHREIGQHIDRIADDDQVGVFLEPGRFHLVEQAEEQIDVAIDEIEPALVGLAAQPGGDDDDVARGDLAHVAGADALIGDQAGAVQQVERLALGHFLVGVDQADAADDAAALQCVMPSMLPTRPPPPMMLTFMEYNLLQVATVNLQF